MSDTAQRLNPEFEPVMNNPIGWAHLRLSGGLRRLVLLGLIYGTAILVFHLMIYRAGREAMALNQFCTAAMTVMLVVSAATIFLLGTAAIKRAVHRDFTSDMIQSHRLSSMSGPIAIVGYLTGPPAQALMLSAVNLLTCTILAMLGGISAGQSILAPAMVFVVMGCLALLGWTATVIVGLSSRGAISVGGLIVLLVICFNAEVVQIVPGLSMLFGSISVVRLTGGATIRTMSEFILVAMAAQLILSLIFFLGAARKYHRDDVIAFTPFLDFAWILLFAILSVAGMRFQDNRALGSFGPPEFRLGLIASCVFMALVCFFSIANAARRSAEWHWRHKHDPHLEQARPAGYLYTALFATILVYCVFMAGIAPIRSNFSRFGLQVLTTHNLAFATAAFFLTLVTFGGIMRFAYAISPKGVFAAIVILFITWLAPLLGDLTVEALDPDLIRDTKRSIFFAISPIGTWISLFKPQQAPIIPGLLIQAGVALAAILISRTARR